ncbi:diguanylate cyclase (GGDEF) domain-containing protein [Virgibacillus subterraneus]|uniref:Diguanylate cyclase (GGDEF) domain-containing protein n=2 Tax=Virgibacillus TaxID=84406 RepID=A0A1H0Y5N8_9BACI|nr:MULTISPECIES: GGDEF domain-containing protein [Virgibacillus]SDQ10403.1 diguanylate cyclase (GGDEF) domain-containing protein [Virgibacillus salinus]SEP68302.1 diguanylate cyclase (GGDEF) domain-containing protein [Virgibacillus subterraneus]
MLRVKIFIIFLFLTSFVLAFMSGPISIETSTYMKALVLYWLFSTLYTHLRVNSKSGKLNMDYGVSYSMSIALFAGPIGLFIYETLYRFTVYIIRRVTKTGDPDELLHTFYNIGSFALNNTIVFYLFFYFYPSFQNIPFGFWLLIILLALIVALLSDIYLITISYFFGDISTPREAFDFIKSRSITDLGKIAFSNGFLLVFLQAESWQMVIALFILNYLVSRSFVDKSLSIQNKVERDKFEQMAYTDFMTEVYNRAFMDKKMKEFNLSGEYLGIIVADIDKFKQYNDNYNHAVGDKVIQSFATTLHRYLNDEDFLFRTGGEEFTIFLRNRTFEECSVLVEQMRDGVVNSPVHAEFHSKNVSISYTASFGLYFYKTSEFLSIEKGYIYADHLLLRSKELGKNLVSVKNGMNDLPLSVRYSE